jgi:MFS family permease
MSLFWTLASIAGGWLLLKTAYRNLALFGMVVLVVGALLMSRIGVNASQILIMLYLAMMGVGMGLSIPAFLIAVQCTVRSKDLGVATSTLQFGRNIGGTLGVSVMGVFLSVGLNQNLLALGVDPASVSLNELLDPLASANAVIVGPLKDALAISIAHMFLVAFSVGLLALIAVMAAPGGKIAQLMKERARHNLPED